MPRTLAEKLENWVGGANTSAPPDALPQGFVPRARNTVLKNIGQETALIGTRRGMATLNSTPVTGSPGMIGGIQYRKKDGTKKTLLVSDTGRLDQLNVDGTTSAINATAFTSGQHFPNFAIANDVCFIVNDVDQKKFDGTSVTGIGITRPAAPTAVSAGGGAMAAGTWDVGLTYFNSLTGIESSLSDFTSVTLGAGNLKINVSWTAPTDPQVTHVRVYIRQQSAGANAYRAIAGATPAPDATYGGYSPSTLSTVLDISATQYGAFTFVAPSTTEFNPPAAGLQYPCFYAQRLFLADSGNVYYSVIKNGVPFTECFDPLNVQPVNPNDGDTIVGLFSMWGKLFIFKRFSLWMLNGTDPNSWTISLVSKDHGCASMRSIASAEGVMYWWTNVSGLAAYDGSGQPVNFSKEFISGSTGSDIIDQTRLNLAHVGIDEANQTLIWSLPDFGSSRNTRLIPFSYRLKRFHAEFWNPMDIYSMFVVEDTDKTRALYMGGYAGQVFKWWAASNDGVPVSTTLIGTVTSAGSNTLTDSNATFATAGGKLIERYVYAISQDRSTIQRARITANTATQLTVSTNWLVALDSTWTYVIGGIQFEMDTPWMLGEPFYKKRYEFLFLETATPDANVVIDIDLFTTMDDSAPKRTKSISLSGRGGLYDATTALYDSSLYGLPTVLFSKLRMALTGKAWRARIRNCQVASDITLYRVAMQSQLLSINR